MSYIKLRTYVNMQSIIKTGNEALLKVSKALWCSLNVRFIILHFQNSKTKFWQILCKECMVHDLFVLF